MKGHKGFTLIELLIVVAIIAILAAIAIPNFLAAQVRSKVSRAKAESQSLATALESYYIDNNVYPAPDQTDAVGTQGSAGDDAGTDGQIPRAITTPIAFVTSIFRDPFKANGRGYYEYGGGAPNSPSGTASANKNFTLWPASGWIVTSYGPDITDGYSGGKLREETGWNDSNLSIPLENSPLTYDPTNGTTSGGDVWRRGP